MIIERIVKINLMDAETIEFWNVDIPEKIFDYTTTGDYMLILFQDLNITIDLPEDPENPIHNPDITFMIQKQLNYPQIDSSTIKMLLLDTQINYGVRIKGIQKVVPRSVSKIDMIYFFKIKNEIVSNWI